MNEAQHNRNARSLASAQAAHDNMAESEPLWKPDWWCAYCGHHDDNGTTKPRYCPVCDSDDIREDDQ